MVESIIAAQPAVDTRVLVVTFSNAKSKDIDNMSLLQKLRTKLRLELDNLLSFDDIDMFDEFTFVGPEPNMVVIGQMLRDSVKASQGKPFDAKAYHDKLVEKNIPRLVKKTRWTPELVRDRLRWLGKTEEERLKSQKVTEWFIMCLFYDQIGHEDMAESCLNSAQIEAGLITLQ